MTDKNKLNQRRHLHHFMLAGTGSDVGKSVLTAAFCRILKQDGFHPAPFKAQNMALNSYVTPDGLEIGRAQAAQAEAAGIPCHVDMNPLLLKPNSDCQSQVVLNGRPIGNSSAYEYFKREGREYLRKEVHAAFDRLSARYSPIVLEGAGSVAELNLQDVDLVNMPIARYASADVFLVADIDRGGVFASAYGSIMLQRPEYKSLIKGIIINKFRGDIKLFEDGVSLMERICGVPVLGVIPYFNDIHIDDEDSVVLEGKADRHMDGKVNVAVIRLKHLSNFTDFDVLEHDPGIHLFYTDDSAELSYADLIIVPGSKTTLEDLAEIKRNGVADAIVSASRRGVKVLGICGGYQMMGEEVTDPDGVESGISRISGLGLLPVKTVLTGKKVTRQVTFTLSGSDAVCEGYEIHMGQTVFTDSDAQPLCRLSDGQADGCMASTNCMGTYIHGILDNAAFRSRLLGSLLKDGLQVQTDYHSYKEREYDRLARFVRQHIDMDLFYRIISGEQE